MANKKKKTKEKQEETAQKKEFKKRVYRDNALGKAMDKLQSHVGKIGIRNKYIERLKTGFISFGLYFLIIYIYTKLAESLVSTPENSAAILALLLSSICICIFNIVKSVMSIRDNKYKILNIILIVLHSLSILLFIGMFFI